MIPDEQQWNEASASRTTPMHDDQTAPVGHTPGPWRVGPVDDTLVTARDGTEVASIDGDYNQPDLWPIMEANARLIAAAPTMLQALKILTLMARTSGGAAGEDAALKAACEQAEAAIALATGSTGE